MLQTLREPIAVTLSRSFVIFSFDRQLASHRSGLPREGPCYPDTKTNFCPYTNDQMIQRLRDVTLLHEPGSEPSYRLENYLLCNRPFLPEFQRVFVRNLSYKNESDLRENEHVGSYIMDQQYVWFRTKTLFDTNGANGNSEMANYCADIPVGLLL